MLVIVARDRPRLFEELKTRFASAPNVSVIFDRRHGFDPVSIDKRQGEELDNEVLWTKGYVITLAESPPL